MIRLRWPLLHTLLVITSLHWITEHNQLVEGAPELLDTLLVQDTESQSMSSEEKSANDLTTKLFLLDELVNLENDVMETKKKRSFTGFGSPLDRLSISTMEVKGKPRKVVDIPKRRYGIPIDRLGINRLASGRG
ncbi:osteocrin [Polypterus senegalus]|nr:osteocrin [Polypterus senegalus]XP_039621673.1 osteocrin [Polypterus senegalus]